MTSKQVNKYSLISFIIGVFLPFILLLTAILFPHIQITSSMKNIVVGVLLLPWISFFIFIIFSMKSGS